MLAASSRERRRLPRKEGFHARGAHWTWVWPCRIDREKKKGGGGKKKKEGGKKKQKKKNKKKKKKKKRI